MSFLVSVAVGVTATLLAGLIAATARELLAVAETVDDNRERSQTNREALREVIKQTDAELEADPITGLKDSQQD
jgi:hypothetical protein